jgi:hypothetical protein
MKTQHDWSRLDAMTEEQRHAAALADPDAQPLSDADMDRTRPTPRLTDRSPRARSDAGAICGALSDPARNAARLGARG